jgi:3-deoxy-D-manno-octulosonic-acid transferase
LIDSTGELRAWQCLADVVIVGKSFLGRGGQNPVEAVLAGKPVLVGPHMENFEAVMALLGQSGAALALRDAGELVAAIEPLLRDAARAAAMAEAGRQALQAHEGATQRSLDGLVSLVQRSTCREGSTT